MVNINPVPPPVRPPVEAPSTPPPGLSPSNSTTATGAAGALAALTVFILGQKGITFPAGMEAAIAVIFATIGGYLPASGRR